MLDTLDCLNIKTAQGLSALWHSASSEHLAMAVWRLPYKADKHLILDLSSQARRTKVDLEELPAGFAFSPFSNEDGKQTFFLKADLHFHFHSIEDLTKEEIVRSMAESHELDSSHTAVKEALLQKVRNFVSAPQPPTKPTYPSVTEPSDEAEHQRFLQLVDKGINGIRRGDFQKVALSRSREVTLPADFDVLRTFEKMCATYLQAFVSLVSIPGIGVWMGASPEILISVDAKGIFRTIALAGTQAAHPEAAVEQAHWTHKEIEEQALVSRYIVNCFKKIRLREYEEEGPKTVLAGNLMHLRTDFWVDTQAVNFPQLGTVMLDLLHPTSAVCGMPKAPAMEFILQHETNKREFYSGFLGPVHVDRETHLFVNLRCMKVREQTAVLYAGAGITAESVAEKEWLETEMKCQTILRIL